MSAPAHLEADWAQIADNLTSTWARRLADTVAESARWQAAAQAAQARITELTARVEALESGDGKADHAAAAGD